MAILMCHLLSVESSARSDTDSDSDSERDVKRPPKKSDDKSSLKRKFIIFYRYYKRNKHLNMYNYARKKFDTGYIYVPFTFRQPSQD